MKTHALFIHEDQILQFNEDLRKDYLASKPNAKEITVDFMAFYQAFKRWVPMCKSPDFIM